MKPTKTTKLSGINIQWPWSKLILDGSKTIETRGYPIPEKHIGQPLAIVQTPGPQGRKGKRIHTTEIVGLVVFDSCFKYETYEQWEGDILLHCVPKDDAQFSFKRSIPKWGWKIRWVKTFKVPVAPPIKRGIVFVSNCKVPI